MVKGRRKLLLADDSTAYQTVVSLTFKDEGMDVTTVSTGDLALEYLEENAPPDIVLADCVMPGLNGYELCERIKSDTRWRHIPVLLLVGYFEPFNEAEARRVGADDVLTKHFQSIRDLMSKVGSMLGGGGGKAADEESSNVEAQERQASATRTGAESEIAPTWESREASTGDSRSGNDAESGADLAHARLDAVPSFADMGMDDQLIEAKPAEYFGNTEGQIQHAMSAPASHSNDNRRDEDATEEVKAPSERDDEGGGQWTSAENESPAYLVSQEPAYLASQEDVGEETLVVPPVISVEQASAQAASAAPSGFAKQMANAAAADDSLLDLGNIEQPFDAAAEADDFILDLNDDDMPPPPASQSSYQANAGMSASTSVERDDAPAASSDMWHADAAGAFAEAAHGEAIRDTPQAFTPTLVEVDEEQERGAQASANEAEVISSAFEVQETPRVAEERDEAGRTQEFSEPSVAPAEEPLPVGMEGSRINRGAEGDVARPPAHLGGGVAVDDAQMADTVSSNQEQIRLDQLSPEVIDAIARRAVELLSKRVVEDIAWEVVPQLAELLIKRRLDEESERR